jgi:hypothetical protein
VIWKANRHRPLRLHLEWRYRPISDTHGLELAALKPPVKQIDAAEVRPS